MIGYVDVGDYVVYEDGVIFSKKYRKELKPRINKGGYYIVTLYEDGTPKTILHHRLIAKCFLPNPFNLPQINHIDGNKANNHVSNLEWCDQSQNQIHAIKNGLKYKKVAQIKDGEVVRVFDTACEAERVTGVNSNNIGMVCNRKRKTAGGFVWRWLS